MIGESDAERAAMSCGVRSLSHTNCTGILLLLPMKQCSVKRETSRPTIDTQWCNRDDCIHSTALANQRNAKQWCCVAGFTLYKRAAGTMSAQSESERAQTISFIFFFVSLFHVFFFSRILFYAVCFFIVVVVAGVVVVLLLLFSLASLVCFVFGDMRVGKCLTNSSKCTQETVYLRYRYDAVVQKNFIYSVSCRSLCLFVCCCLLMNSRTLL